MLIFDAHLDLAMNALEWNRDLRWSVPHIRQSELGMSDKPDRARNTVSFDAMRRGNVGLCVATQIARYVKPGNDLPGWNSPEQAWSQTQGQLSWYREMERLGHLRQITDLDGLGKHLAKWEKNPDEEPIGYILSLEGADSLVTLEHLEIAWESGLRAVGPAHDGPGTYAHGTDSTGGIGIRGKELLKKMEELNIILDATHLCDESFWEAMTVFQGPVWASHNNCRKFVDHNRQFSDEQIRELIDREAVIGMALDAWMMVPNWQRGVSTPVTMDASLRQTIENIDHICQIAGNTDHVGIGTDLDGGFGTEQTPVEIDTITDLRKIPALLKERGYSSSEIEGIMSRNFIRFLERAWT